MNNDDNPFFRTLKKFIVDETIKRTIFDAFVYLPDEEFDDKSETNTEIKKMNEITKIKILSKLHGEFYSMILGELEDAIKAKTVDLNNIIKTCRLDNLSKLKILILMLEKQKVTSTEIIHHAAKYDDSIKWIFHIIEYLKQRTGFIRCSIRAEALLNEIYLKNNGHSYTKNNF